MRPVLLIDLVEDLAVKLDDGVVMLLATKLTCSDVDLAWAMDDGEHDLCA